MLTYSVLSREAMHAPYNVVSPCPKSSSPHARTEPLSN
jgi:hypothetical protein